MSIVTWRRRLHLLPARLLLIVAISFCILAILLNLEAYQGISVNLWQQYSQILCVYLVAWAILFIATQSPQVLVPAPWLYSIHLFYVVLGLMWGLLDWPSTEVYWGLVFLPVVLASVFFSFLQWIMAEAKPLERWAAQVVLVALLGLLSLSGVFYFIPRWLGQTPVLPIWGIQILMLGLLVSFSLALLQFRRPIAALEEFLLTLSVQRRYEKHSIYQFLPEFSRQLATATQPAQFEAIWQLVLQERFSPLKLIKQHESITASLLLDKGMQLCVSSLDNHSSYQLVGKKQGTQLFNRTDVRKAEALLTVIKMANTASAVRQQAIQEERQRIMQDLHDTVGAKLLTLTHKLTQYEHKMLAREALATLRDTIKLSLKDGPVLLEEVLANWRVETADRVEAVGAELEWEQNEAISECYLSPTQAIELAHLFRELVSNALRHAEPSLMQIQFALQDHVLSLQVRHDSQLATQPDPLAWQVGTGIKSMRQRLARRGGQLQFYRDPHQPSSIVADVVIPLA